MVKVLSAAIDLAFLSSHLFAPFCNAIHFFCYFGIVFSIAISIPYIDSPFHFFVVGFVFIQFSFVLDEFFFDFLPIGLLCIFFSRFPCNCFYWEALLDFFKFFSFFFIGQFYRVFTIVPG